MSTLDHRIPPPLIGAATAGAMVGAALWSPAVIALPDGLRIWLAVALVVVGLGFDIWGLLAFRKARTTVNPLRPDRSTQVVSTGVYRITRNPMYLGMALMLLGLAVYLALPWALLGPVGFVAYITRFQIRPEEQALTARFGAAYTAYCDKVRRWL